MELLIETIQAEPQRMLLTATPEELALKLDLAELVSDVVYSLAAHRIEDEIFVDGEITYTLRCTCARCLSEFESSFRVPLNLVLQLVADVAAGEEEGERDDFVVLPSSRSTYLIDPQLRDLISLEFPLKPLCREDCAGLCQQCGTNLNVERCSCTSRQPDPRWDTLRRLNAQED